MRAIVFDEKLQYVEDYKKPLPHRRKRVYTLRSLRSKVQAAGRYGRIRGISA